MTYHYTIEPDNPDNYDLFLRNADKANDTGTQHKPQSPLHERRDKKAMENPYGERLEEARNSGIGLFFVLVMTRQTPAGRKRMAKARGASLEVGNIGKGFNIIIN